MSLRAPDRQPFQKARPIAMHIAMFNIAKAKAIRKLSKYGISKNVRNTPPIIVPIVSYM